MVVSWSELCHTNRFHGVFLYLESQKIQNKQVWSPCTALLTNHACSSRTGEYWSSVVCATRGLYWHELGLTLPCMAIALCHRFLKRFLLSVRKKSIIENFVNESYARCLLCNDSTYYLCRALPPTYFMTFWGGFWIHYLSSINKLSVLVKGYIVFI